MELSLIEKPILVIINGIEEKRDLYIQAVHLLFAHCRYDLLWGEHEGKLIHVDEPPPIRVQVVEELDDLLGHQVHVPEAGGGLDEGFLVQLVHATGWVEELH
jgi:hypothetical protein